MLIWLRLTVFNEAHAIVSIEAQFLDETKHCFDKLGSLSDV